MKLEEKLDAQSFCYWLHGFFEISDSKKLTEKQVQIIKDHLDLVFEKITPDRNDVLDLEASKGTAGKTHLPSFTEVPRDSKVWDLSPNAGKIICSSAIDNLNKRGPTVYC